MAVVRDALFGAVCSIAVVGIVAVGFALGSGYRERQFVAADFLNAVQLCLGSTTTGATDFNSEMALVNERMHRAMVVDPTGNPDLDFARVMIPHHQGAIDMAMVQLKYGRDKTLRRLAQSIIVEQEQEIAYMRSLLIKPSAGATISVSSTGYERAMR